MHWPEEVQSTESNIINNQFDHFTSVCILLVEFIWMELRAESKNRIVSINFSIEYFVCECVSNFLSPRGSEEAQWTLSSVQHFYLYEEEISSIRAIWAPKMYLLDCKSVLCEPRIRRSSDISVAEKTSNRKKFVDVRKMLKGGHSESLRRLFSGQR